MPQYLSGLKAIAANEFDKAASDLQSAASCGYPPGEYQRGLMLKKNDFVRALRFFANSAYQGYVPAQIKIAELLSSYKKTPDQYKGLESGFKEIQDRTANQGNTPESPAKHQFQSALIALKSDDKATAMGYLEWAAKQGHPGAQYELSMLLSSVPDRAQESVNLLIESAQQEYPPACEELRRQTDTTLRNLSNERTSLFSRLSQELFGVQYFFKSRFFAGMMTFNSSQYS